MVEEKKINRNFKFERPFVKKTWGDAASFSLGPKM